MKNPEWVDKFKHRMGRHLAPHSMTPLTKFASSEERLMTIEPDLEYRFYIEFATSFRIRGEADDEEIKLARERASNMIIRYVYKEPLDALYEARDHLYQDGYRGEALTIVSDIIETLQGMSK